MKTVTQIFTVWFKFFIKKSILIKFISILSNWGRLQPTGPTFSFLVIQISRSNYGVGSIFWLDEGPIFLDM